MEAIAKYDRISLPSLLVIQFIIVGGTAHYGHHCCNSNDVGTIKFELKDSNSLKYKFVVLQ